MSKELVKFIEARLAEDEQTAQEPPTKMWTLAASATVDDGEDTWYVIDQRNARHIVRHDPARVLREVEAKRLILAEWHQVVLENRRAYLVDPKPAVVVLALALSYADHPDYRAEWAP